MATIPVNGFSGLPYADDMKRQYKNGHNGHANAGFPERLVELRKDVAGLSKLSALWYAAASLS
jgi:hypothetical protein